MSMLSAQIDELRQMADGQATYRDARAVMLQAADTIWQLRDDLQRANVAVQDAEHDESMAWDRVRKAEAENDKLRELLSEIAKLVTNPYGGCLRPGCAHGCPHHLECDEELHTCFYVDRIRELGIEVEG